MPALLVAGSEPEEPPLTVVTPVMPGEVYVLNVDWASVDATTARRGREDVSFMAADLSLSLSDVYAVVNTSLCDFPSCSGKWVVCRRKKTIQICELPKSLPTTSSPRHISHHAKRLLQSSEANAYH